MNLSQINSVNINIHKLFIFKTSWLNLHVDYIWNVWNIIFFHPDGLTRLIFNDCNSRDKVSRSFHLTGDVRTDRVNLQTASKKSGKECVGERLMSENQNEMNWFMGLEELTITLSPSSSQKEVYRWVGETVGNYQPFIFGTNFWLAWHDLILIFAWERQVFLEICHPPLSHRNWHDPIPYNKEPLWKGKLRVKKLD